MEIAAALQGIDRAIAAGPFQATWESLENYTVPQWYLDGKFGIFIHWGAYSVPAFNNEWYPRLMYLQDDPKGRKCFEHHLTTYGPQNKFGYKDFIPQFKAERFDPAQWAALFKEAGAKFVVPVAEHHDGFAMYDCGFSDWTAVKMGPKRDTIGELAAAVRKAGMVFGLSSHRAEHWWFFEGGMKFDSDVRDPRYASLYGPAQPKSTQPDAAFLDDWLARTCELVDKYEPQLVWFDWWIEEPAFKPYLQRFGAYYYNRAAQWQRGVAINYKKEAYPAKAAVLDIERGKLASIRPFFWQTDTSVSKNSWGYITHHNYKTADSIVDDLVDIVSKNGALLLNVGPRPDGTIPEPEEQMLREIGQWLSLNGEAIYGTRPWRIYGEGPTDVPTGDMSEKNTKDFTAQDVRFTAKDGALYATCLAWPEGGALTIRSLAAGAAVCPEKIASVELLGCREQLKFQRDAEGLRITLPAQTPCDFAYVFKLRLK